MILITHISGKIAVIQVDGIKTFDTYSFRSVGCESRIIYCNICCTVDGRRAEPIGSIGPSIQNHCAAASVASDGCGRFTIGFYIKIPAIKGASASGMYTAGGALLCFNVCICRIDRTITICEQTSSTICVRCNTSAFYVSCTVCCQNGCTYPIKAGIIATGAFRGLPGYGYVVKSHIGTGRDQSCIFIGSCGFKGCIFNRGVFCIFIDSGVAVNAFRLTAIRTALSIRTTFRFFGRLSVRSLTFRFFRRLPV